MAQDRSRSAFNVRHPKHWSSVQAQQGRLLSDDDWNEADAIDKEDVRRTRVAVIGPSGSPDDGFKVLSAVVTGSAIDFALASGTLFVGGLRATLEDQEQFSLQKDWLRQTVDDRPALGATDRIDLVYLEAWQQPVTAVEDDELREVALGGPDTSVRLRTMRRVRVRANVGTEDCGTAWGVLTTDLGGLTPENERLNDATLTIGYIQDTSAAPDLCSPSTQTGFLGAENQAIRVEIGTAATTFLWGYDNASPLYRVQVTTDTSGAQVIHFLTIPKDEAHWPVAQQIVELLPWSAVLPNGEKVAEPAGGQLGRVTASYDPATQNIKVQPSVGATFGTAWQSRSDSATLGTVAQSFFYLRVWNRGSDTTSQPEIAFSPGVPVALAGTGLSVAIAGSTFRTGDFWIIAARPESPAKVVPWDLETGRAAEGIRRFYAPLGLIHWRPGGAAATTFDCRATFDPLTTRQGGGCCITVSPDPGWERTIDAVVGNADVCICFEPGDYTTERTFEFHNNNVIIRGDARGSRIHGSGIETVFRFVGCASVQVEDLSIEATATAQEAHATPKPHLAGAITTTNCAHVAILRVVARCASGPVSSASCIALYCDPPAAGAPRSSIRVEGCDLVVGANQIGLSVINAGRSTISDNTVSVDATENATLPPAWLKDAAFRAVFRRTLIWRYGLDDAATAKTIPADATHLTLGDAKIWIETDPQLAQDWKRLLARGKLHRVDYRTLGEYLHGKASDLVYGRGVIGKQKYSKVNAYITGLLGLRTGVTQVRGIASQGIVVAGVAADEVRIAGNTVRDAVQGIHVGISTQRTRNPGKGAPVSDTAGRVVIANNAIHVTLMPESIVERHGIFVGNCQSLLVEDNFLDCERLGPASRLAIEGIRVYGFLGRMAYITRNHLSGFTTGIHIAPLNNLADGATSMWRVNDNVAFGAAHSVDTSLAVGHATHVISSGNLP